jgi:phosphoglycolate phosphatase-like HAD superfamily hydrolase
VTAARIVVFDLDGTLIDSDAALEAPFTALGVDPARVPWGLPLPDACRRVGISVGDYLDHYDETRAVPFEGVEELLEELPRWGVCSNKHPDSGPVELERLGWAPAAAWFNPGLGPKRLGPVLAELQVEPVDVVFVGDTDHDERCARTVGCDFAVAGWNPRAVRGGEGVVLSRPLELLDLLADSRSS